MFKLPTTADNFPATGKINPSSPKYSLSTLYHFALNQLRFTPAPMQATS